MPRSFSLPSLAAMLLGLAVLHAPCRADDSGASDVAFFGPLPSQSQDPLGLLALQAMPEAAKVLADADSGQLTLAAQLTSDRRLENAQGVREHYHYELATLTADYRRRLGAGELGATLPVYHRGSDSLAPLIDGFHELLGFRDRRTPDFPEGGYVYSIATAGGTVYDGNSSGVAVGDLSLRYKHPLRRTGSSALSARVMVKAPTGRPAQAAGSGSWDAGAGLLWQRRLGRRWQAYANCDYVLTGPAGWDNAQRQNSVQLMGAVEYALARNVTATAQFQAATNPLTLDNSETDEDCGELAVGLQGRLAGGERWGAWLREDILGDTGPDVSFGASLGWEF